MHINTEFKTILSRLYLTFCILSSIGVSCIALMEASDIIASYIHQKKILKIAESHENQSNLQCVECKKSNPRFSCKADHANDEEIECIQSPGESECVKVKETTGNCFWACCTVNIYDRNTGEVPSRTTTKYNEVVFRELKESTRFQIFEFLGYLSVLIIYPLALIMIKRWVVWAFNVR